MQNEILQQDNENFHQDAKPQGHFAVKLAENLL